MKEGDIILCPISTITHVPKPIEGEGLVCELVEKKGQYFLKYRISKDDLGDSHEPMFLKFKFICAGLSIATIGQFWVQDVLLNENLQPIWVRERTIQLVKDKEILPEGPSPLTAQNYTVGEDVTTWVALKYPRVFNYYHVGLFLLRSSLPVEYLYADVMLNFFKIIELVTYKRTNKKPELDVILEDSKALKIISVNEAEIRKFYIVRSRDAAHDHDQVQGISRRQAVECKMWVDELIIKDMINRGGRPANILEVRDSPNGAVIRTVS